MRLSIPQSKVFRSTARFRVLVAGRRFGKTHLSVPELLRRAWGPEKDVWYIAPTYKQAKLISWEKFKSIAKPWILKTNESELSVRLVTGGSIRLMGAENYDSLRGPGLDGVVFDEYADIDPRAWTEVVRPMLSDRKGTALFIGTPKGFNHFSELYQAAKLDGLTWAGFHFTTIQGGNVDADEIAAARKDLDEKTFRQEYEASFENMFGGRVYYAFDRTGNQRAASYMSSHGTIYWSLDFNVTPMCSVICQVEPGPLNGRQGRFNGTLSVLDEIVLPDSNVWEVCEAFVRRTAAWARRAGVLDVRLYGDATGHNRQHTGPSSYQMIRDFFAARPEYRLTYHQKTNNPPVTDRVNAVNAMLCNADGERRLFIDPRCKSVMKDLEQVAWKMDANGNATGMMDQHGPTLALPAGLTHISDALGYLIETEFGLQQRGGPRASYVA
jgi:hypothetical protein